MSDQFKMSLVEFWNEKRLKNLYVAEPEFESLYCRKGNMYLPVKGTPVWVDNLLHIANITANNPQTGAFTRLMHLIDAELRCNVYVENVFNAGFVGGLLRMGFEQLERWDYGGPPCFLRLRA